MSDESSRATAALQRRARQLDEWSCDAEPGYITAAREAETVRMDVAIAAVLRLGRYGEAPAAAAKETS